MARAPRPPPAIVIWIGLAALLLALAGFGTAPYARVLGPGIEAVARVASNREPWRVAHFDVATDGWSRAVQFELTTVISGASGSPPEAARLVTHKSAAGATRTLIVLLGIAALWPSGRSRLLPLGAAAIAAYVLTSVEVGFALLGESALAGSRLAGDADGVPVLARWADFTEAGGSIALAVFAGLLAAAAFARTGGSRARAGA